MAVSNSKSVSFNFLKNPLSENKMEEKGIWHFLEKYQ